MNDVSELLLQRAGETLIDYLLRGCPFEVKNLESTSGDWSVIYIIALVADSVIESQDSILFSSRDLDCAS